jgi:hypothetical protein
MTNNSPFPADADSRPEVLAAGREQIANAVKMIAFANKSVADSGMTDVQEFCVLPSVYRRPNPRHEGQEFVGTRFDLVGV